MSDSIGRSVIRYDVCALVCKVNEHALSPSNLRSSFKDIMFPIDPNVINPNCTVPSLVYTGKALLENSTTSTDKMLRVATSSYIPIIFSPRTFRTLCRKFL